jgi:O-antigen/teichoic acid export membrane protein
VRTRRSLLSFGTGLFTNVVSLLVGVVSLPYLLRWLGEERYGAYRATLDWFGYVSLLELGLGAALLPLLNQALARGDPSLLRDRFAAGLRSFALMTVIMAITALILIAFIDQLVPVRPELAGELRTGAWMVFASLSFWLIHPFRALAEARQLGYQVQLLLLVQQLLTTGIALWLASQGYGIPSQCLAFVVGALPLQLTLLSRGARVLGGTRAAILHVPSPEARREIWSLNWPNLLAMISGRVGLLSDTIVASLLLTPAAVVPLVVTVRLAGVIQGQLQSIGNSSWAALGEIRSRGEHDLFRRRVVELTHLVAVGGVGLLVPIAVFNGDFVRLWVGHHTYGGTALTVAACLNALLQAAFSLWGWCFTATGDARRPVAVYLLSAGVNLGASVLLTWRLGVAGPVLGTSCAFLLVSLPGFPRIMAATYGVPARALYGALARPMAVGLPFAGILALARQAYAPEGWISLGALMAASSLTYFALAWAFLLKPEERNLWRARLGRA